MSTQPPSAPPSQPSPSTPPSKSSYEELDSPSRTLPPVVPILIAAVVVAAVVFFIVRSNRPVTPATGSITKVLAVEQSTKDRVLVSIEVHVKNGSEKPIYVRDVTVKANTSAGELTDTPAPANDVPRYFQAYPAL